MKRFFLSLFLAASTLLPLSRQARAIEPNAGDVGDPPPGYSFCIRVLPGIIVGTIGGIPDIGFTYACDNGLGDWSYFTFWLGLPEPEQTE